MSNLINLNIEVNFNFNLDFKPALFFFNAMARLGPHLTSSSKWVGEPDKQ